MKLSRYLVGVYILFSGTSLHSQEWRYYGGDAGATRYSKLSQINKKNVTTLKIAWMYDTGDFSDGTQYPTRSSFECTPLVIDGVMYVTTPFCRLIALNSETGQRAWEFDPRIDRREPRNLFVNRGAAYWTDGHKKRVFLGDLDGRLFSIDAETGEPDPEFANKGVLDLKKGMTEKSESKIYSLTSPVAVCGNVVINGEELSEFETQGASGDIRGFDTQTGKLLWRFHVAPHPGEPGNDTWAGNSWLDRGGLNAWGGMSVDAKRGMLFAPLTSPSYDYYGADRKGTNLFGDSIVALNCATGKLAWYFQTIHHDLWDWDLPAQPNLVTVHHDGREIAAVAQTTKTGFVFLLDRDTGKPLFPVEERLVPQSRIPGEETSLTQPFPVKPPPFARQSMTPNDVTEVTPESRRECLEMVQGAIVDGPMFRPVAENWTVIFPGTNGGANWGGASFDPTTDLLYVNEMDVGSLFRMTKQREGAKLAYVNRSTRNGRFWDSHQYPCQRPPWGTLTAIDLNSGQFRWRVPLGEFEELTGRGVPKTGTPNIGGSIVTGGGLVFIGATNDAKFRAFDKDTGEEIWATALPASAHATPMTYLGKQSGKQFVAIAAGGGNKYNRSFSGKLLVFGLP